MKKETTAKELFYKMIENNDCCTSTEMMIEFANRHVKAALEAASKKAEMLDDKECWRNCSCEHPCKIVDKDSILNAYSESKIK